MVRQKMHLCIPYRLVITLCTLVNVLLAFVSFSQIFLHFFRGFSCFVSYVCKLVRHDEPTMENEKV